MINQDLMNQTLSAIPEDSIAKFCIIRNLADSKLFDLFAVGKDASILACVEVGLSFESASELQQILNAPYELPEVEDIKVTKTLFNPKKA